MKLEPLHRRQTDNGETMEAAVRMKTEGHHDGGCWDCAPNGGERTSRVSKPLLVFTALTFLLTAGVGAAQTATGFGCNQQRKAEGVGINISNMDFKALGNPNVLNALEDSGVGWIRVNIYWAWTERSPGDFQWADLDSGLKNIRNAGLHVLAILNGPVPCWAISGSSGRTCKVPEHTVPLTSQWRDFVTAAVTRYRDEITYWEIWNEPDLIYAVDVPDPNQRLSLYRDKILIPAATAIHHANPTATVVAPGFAAMVSGNTAPGPELEAALSEILSNGAGSQVDIISLHSYYPATGVEKAQSARAALRRMGMAAKPIWITEDGIGTDDPAKLDSSQFSPGRQVAFLNNELRATLDSGLIQRVFWFSLVDSGTHANDYGLVDLSTDGWRPRSTYTSLRTLIGNACAVQ